MGKENKKVRKKKKKTAKGANKGLKNGLDYFPKETTPLAQIKELNKGTACFKRKGCFFRGLYFFHLSEVINGLKKLKNYIFFWKVKVAETESLKLIFYFFTRPLVFFFFFLRVLFFNFKFGHFLFFFFCI